MAEDLRNVPLDELEAEVARRRAELDEKDACPGAGKCHGCAGWCDHCGDVALVCDSPTCDRHRCECGDRAVIVDEGLGYCGIWASPKWQTHIRGEDMGFCRREPGVIRHPHCATDRQREDERRHDAHQHRRGARDRAPEGARRRKALIFASNPS